MGSTATQLVGRAVELALLDRLLDRVRGGEPAACAVSGDAGMGKTRLLAELATRADAQDCLVLAGSGSEFERDVPFGLVVGALEDYVAGLDPERLEALDGGARARLAPLFPTLGRADAEPVSAHDRHRTHQAFRELLRVLAAEIPVVLALDDVHWADSGSAELLGALLRRPPAAPVLLVLALRPRQVSEPLAAALARAQRSTGFERARLAALTPQEAEQLLGDAAAAQRLYAASGGNPFYLHQLARASGEPEPAAGDAARADKLPAPVAAALAGELSLLRPGVRRVLEGASVAGDPFEPELAAAAADVPEDEVVAALDELERADLVRPTDVPRRFRFRHPLVRRAVYDAAPGGWRLGAHERCAEALAARGMPATERAHHVERSARIGDRAAVAVLTEAAHAMSAQAPASAARTLAAALRLVPAGAPAAERVALLLPLAVAHLATGGFRDGLAAITEALDLVEDPAVRVRLIGRSARVEHVLGEHEAARRHLTEALAALTEPASQDGALLMIELAFDGLFSGDYAVMHAWARKAVEAARPLGDPALLASATGTLATAAAMAGATAEALARLDEAAALLDGLRDDQLGLYVDAAASVASAELNLDRVVQANAHAERTLRVARASGQGHVFPLLFPIIGTARMLRGDLRGAAELLDEAVEVSRLAGNGEGLAWNLWARALAAMAGGDVDTALATGEESVSLLAAAPRGTFAVAMAGAALADARLAAGDPAGADALLVEKAAGETLPGVPGTWRVHALGLRARCLLALGRPGDAEAAVAAARAAADRLDLPLGHARAGLAAAELALAAGEGGHAAALALAAAGRAEAAGSALDAAGARLLAGRALAAAGRTEEAADLLEQVATTFAECGALPRRDEAERELGRLGRRAHRRTRAGRLDGTGIETLTARELEVARLVVDRRTNPEIAAALFLSPKTVETHVRHLFQKLGVSSRVEVARAIERADRAGNKSL
jgi:DNA-binding NarL/FixJ family response regulator